MGDGNGEFPGEGETKVVVSSLPLASPGGFESRLIMASLALAPAVRTVG